MFMFMLEFVMFVMFFGFVNRVLNIYKDFFFMIYKLVFVFKSVLVDFVFVVYVVVVVFGVVGLYIVEMLLG